MVGGVVGPMHLTVLMTGLFLLLGAALTVATWWELKSAGPAGALDDAATGRTETAKPETLEGSPVAQLLDGQISAGQYLREMERMAERDADRYPMSVPEA